MTRIVEAFAVGYGYCPYVGGKANVQTKVDFVRDRIIDLVFNAARNFESSIAKSAAVKALSPLLTS